jgi:hypothetical protein
MTRVPSIPEPGLPVVLSADEAQVVQRLRMTPEERTAEQETRSQARLDSMSPDQRQAEDARAAKLAAMTPQERQVFFLGRHMADLSRLLKRAADKGLLDVNLMEIVDGKLLERLVGDPILLCDVIYAVCKPEADAKSIADEDFGRAMAGDAIELGTTALLEELCDFFPQGRRRLLRKALEKLKKLESIALTAAETRLDSPELERRMAEELEAMPSGTGGSSGSLPASSASIPAP